MVFVFPIVVLSSCGELAPTTPSNTGKVQTSASQKAELSIQALLSAPHAQLQNAISQYYEGSSEQAFQINRWYMANPQRFDQLDPEARFDLHLINSFATLTHQQRDVLDKVLTLEPTNQRQHVDYLAMLAQALSQADRQAQAVQVLQYVKSLDYARDRSTQDRLNLVLWETLTSLSNAEIESRRLQTKDSNLSKWWELAGVYNSSLSQGAWSTRWQQWIAQNPNHESVSWFVGQHPTTQRHSNHFAVLLPLTGNDAYTQAAKAIRDGWLTAHFENASVTPHEKQPTFTFYDTEGENIKTLVPRAFDQGADTVVGPLSREAVNSVVTESSHSGSVLLLNRPTVSWDEQPSKVRSLAWSIEDEALILAEKLSENGKVRCVLLHGNKPWMLRARQAFEANLREPASIVAIDRVDDLAKATDVVGSTLGIDESKARHKYLESILNFSVEFNPRFNKEVNTLVAFIELQQLEAILESLRFHLDRNIDIYVTESAVRGDLPRLANNLRFTASPWRIYETGLEAKVKRQFLASPSAESFFALGIDAYRFSNLWSRMKTNKLISGSAGRYKLEPTGEIRRIPEIGVVKNGTLAPQPRSNVTEDITRFL